MKPLKLRDNLDYAIITMLGIFKKRIEDNIKEHTKKLVSLDLKTNRTLEGLNEQIRLVNRLIDAIKNLDRKLDLLVKSFQLEYNGKTYVKRRK